jgi:hypothetical protein
VKGGSYLTDKQAISPAHKKIGELQQVIPEMVSRLAQWQPDGDGCFLYFSETLPVELQNEINNVVTANAGFLVEDEVTGRLMFRFPVDTPTCLSNGKLLYPFDKPVEAIMVDPPLEPVPTPVSVIPPPTADMSPIGAFSLRYCFSCTRKGKAGGVYDCKWEQCHSALIVEVENKKLDILTKLLTMHERQWSNLVENAYNHSIATRDGKTPPAQIPINAPIVPQQPQQTLPVPPQPAQKGYVSNPNLTEEQKEALTCPPSEHGKYFIADGLCWARSTTSTGKYCEKAFEEKNLKNGGPCEEYLALQTAVAQKKGGKGYFYFCSTNENKHPYIARMPSQGKK